MTNFRLLLEFLQLVMQISPYFTHDDKKLQKFTKFSSHFVAQIQASFPTFRK